MSETNRDLAAWAMAWGGEIRTLLAKLPPAEAAAALMTPTAATFARFAPEDRTRAFDKWVELVRQAINGPPRG